MTSRIALAILLTAATVAAQDGPAALNGRWDAIVVANKVEIPFQFEIVTDAKGIRGSFFNGDRKITSAPGTFENSVLTFEFPSMATKLKVTLANSELTGEYQRPRPRPPYPVRLAKAAQKHARPAASAPSIDGTWIVGTKSEKGEKAWRFIAKQNGGDVSATILRVDGDTGTLTGSYRDGRFVLSHFSGARPLLLVVTPAADGTLTMKLNANPELVAAREGTARAAAIGAPTDPDYNTSVKDANELFKFAFPDLNGRIVSNTDAKFAGKVVLVNIGGSWCPNCHDEAPFLSALYKKYRAKGLEIVLLSFEEEDQLKDPTRLRAFIKEYGIDYTVLVPGTPDDAQAKLPQAVNFNAYPTTFVLGRDGRVKAVHTGFPSPGSGAFYAKAEREMTELVERLLAARPSTE